MTRITYRRALVAVAASAAIILSGCGSTEDNEPSAGGEGDGGVNCDAKLAFFGALTGPAAGLGIEIQNGVKLAVDQFNAENGDDCVELGQFDSQGSPDKAPDLANEAAGDDTLIGLIGPAFSGESAAAGPIFADAGLATISPSATNPTLADEGWDTFHRALGNDNTQGPAAAAYIKELGSKSVFVMDDASEYGAGLAGIVEESLADSVAGTDTIQVGQTDFSASATKVTSADADALFFGGYYAEASLLISQLRDAGWKGTFVVADGVKDPGFIDGAGAAAEGTVITCPCLPPEDPAAGDFAGDYEAEYGQAPGTYGAEAYDATNVFLAGIKEGVSDREAMLTFVNEYDAPGVTKQMKFDEKGEVADVKVYAYKVEGGEIVSDKEIAVQ